MEIQKAQLDLRAESERDSDLKERKHLSSLYSADQYIWAYKKVLEYGDKEEPVLDWGCGNGHFSYFLALNDFKKIFGYEFEEPSLYSLINRKSSNFNFSIADKSKPKDLPYKDDMFNTVCSIGVLEHVRDTGGNEEESLKEIRRILKPNGIFICAHLPNKYSWIEFISKYIPGKHYHKHKYSKKEIIKMINTNGFMILEIVQYGILPRNIIGSALPWLGDNILFRKSFGIIDKVLCFLIKPISQNYGIVAIKI